jgi:hypothetical protein
VSLGEIVRLVLEPFGPRAAIEGEEVTLTTKEMLERLARAS